jgi:hypothetical protein
MSDSTIPPVLSEAQWSRALQGSSVLAACLTSACADASTSLELEVDARGLMALCNASLPEGSPLKITAETVADMEAAAAELYLQHSGSAGGDVRLHDVAVRLFGEAAKLAALLPPSAKVQSE